MAESATWTGRFTTVPLPGLSRPVRIRAYFRDGAPIVIHDLTRPFVDGFPDGWNSASDIKEMFLVAGALEIQERRRINPLNPNAQSTHNALPARFRFDSFGELLRWGTSSYAEWNQAAALSESPSDLHARHQALRRGAEQIVGPTLYAMASDLVDELLRGISTQQEPEAKWSQFLRKAALLEVGVHGQAILLARAERLVSSDRGQQALSHNELSLLNGTAMRAAAYEGFPVIWAQPLHTSPGIYASTMWLLAFRCIELAGPDPVLQKLEHRVDVVNQLLEQGAALGQQQGSQFWPGWSDISLTWPKNGPHRYERSSRPWPFKRRPRKEPPVA